jgi:hypothetical protein
MTLSYSLLSMSVECAFRAPKRSHKEGGQIEVCHGLCSELGMSRKWTLAAESLLVHCMHGGNISVLQGHAPAEVSAAVSDSWHIMR